MRRAAAFTLIEMLVVISIISLLLALTMPSLRGARSEARAVLCANNTRQYANAFRMYGDDHADTVVWFADEYNASYWNHETFWYNMVAPYLGLQATWSGDPYLSSKNSANWRAEVRRCPSGQAWVGVHYGLYNNTTPPRGPIMYGARAVTQPRQQWPAFRHSHIRNPSTWYMLFDTSGHFMYSPNGWPLDTDGDGDGVLDTYSVFTTLSHNTYLYNGARPRVHHDATNAAFCDTHVERVSFETFIDPNHDYWHDE